MPLVPEGAGDRQLVRDLVRAPSFENRPRNLNLSGGRTTKKILSAEPSFTLQRKTLLAIRCISYTSHLFVVNIIIASIYRSAAQYTSVRYRNWT